MLHRLFDLLAACGCSYVAGVYNGYLTTDPSHRARIPSPFNVQFAGVQGLITALDMEFATYYRRAVVPATELCSVELADALEQSCTCVLCSIYSVSLQNVTRFV